MRIYPGQIEQHVNDNKPTKNDIKTSPLSVLPEMYRNTVKITAVKRSFLAVYGFVSDHRNDPPG
jgi:hypothetical protein